MRRRLLVAKALVHDPEMLILDEPTAGVDVDLRKSLWKYIKKINTNGTTICLTTHYIEEAEELCDNITIINKGRVILGVKNDVLYEFERGDNRCFFFYFCILHHPPYFVLFRKKP